MLARQFPPWAFLIIGLVPITLLLLLGGPLPKPLIFVLTPVAMIWAAAMTMLHWKRLDEAARAAHRWAWYWGGSIGLAGAMIAAALMLVLPELASSAAALTHFIASPKYTTEQLALFSGVVLCGLAQAAGFLGAWIYWWAAKR